MMNFCELEDSFWDGEGVLYGTVNGADGGGMSQQEETAVVQNEDVEQERGHLCGKLCQNKSWGWGDKPVQDTVGERWL